MLLNPIKRIFRPFKRFAAKVLHYDKIHGRIDAQAMSQNSQESRIENLERLQFDMGNLLGLEAARFPTTPWYDQNLCEPSVVTLPSSTLTRRLVPSLLMRRSRSATGPTSQVTI